MLVGKLLFLEEVEEHCDSVLVVSWHINTTLNESITMALFCCAQLSKITKINLTQTSQKCFCFLSFFSHVQGIILLKSITCNLHRLEINVIIK